VVVWASFEVWSEYREGEADVGIEHDGANAI